MRIPSGYALTSKGLAAAFGEWTDLVDFLFTDIYAGAYVERIQNLCPKLTFFGIKATSNHSLVLEAEGGIGAVKNEVLS